MILYYCMGLMFFYSGRWKPFRVSFFFSLIFTVLVFLGKQDTTYAWMVYPLTFLTIFVPIILVLYVLTILFVWLIPPQKGAEGVWQDWWKP